MPRQTIVDAAISQLGHGNPEPYWREVFGNKYPGIKYAWCGVFALWCLHQGSSCNWKWITGKGFLWDGDRLRLKTTKNPKPGDIGYINVPNQHYGIVEDVVDGQVHCIAGNTPLVSRQVFPVRAVYFWVESLVTC